MCFRPAESELPPVICKSCGKRINRIGGQLPSKCPFCKSPTDGMTEEQTKIPTPSAPTVPANPKQ